MGWKRMMAAILLIALGLGALVFGAVLTAVCLSAGAARTPEPSDCIIVLGAHVWMDGRLSNALTYRCEAALEAWQSGVAPVMIVCGAKGRDEPEAEAAVMRRWMLERGVPGDRVIAEPHSLNTEQNFRNARAIMEARGFKTCAVCTNSYHLTRALWLARDAGLRATGISAPSTRDPVSVVRGRVRETCSWILYFLRKTAKKVISE